MKLSLEILFVLTIISHIEKYGRSETRRTQDVGGLKTLTRIIDFSRPSPLASFNFKIADILRQQMYTLYNMVT